MISTVVLLLIFGYGIAYELQYVTRAFVASHYLISILFLPCYAILLAMSAATGEYTQQTLRFSSALPVSLRTVAWARLLGAWTCLIIPVVITTLIATGLLATGIFEQAELRPDDYANNHISLLDRPSLSHTSAVGFLWTSTTIALVTGLSQFTLISLLGTWCRSEGSVGLIGAIVTFASLSVVLVGRSLKEAGFGVAANWIGALLPGSLAISWGYQEIDGSQYSDLELAPFLSGPLVVSVLATGLIGCWFANRYGHRRIRGSNRRFNWMIRWMPVGPQFGSRLRIHWPGQWGSLIWLNARQSIPLCIAGFVIAVLITVSDAFQENVNAELATRVMGQLASSAWIVGLLWGAIIAVGIFSSELQSKLKEFWQSRPIALNRWFWMKYGVGLIALLGSLDFLPFMLSRANPEVPGSERVGLSYLACFPLQHVLVYSLAVAALCRTRRPVHAAIAGIMGYAILDQVLESIPVYPALSMLNVYNRLHAIEFPDGTAATSPVQISLLGEGYPLVYGTVIVLVVIAALMARRFVISRPLLFLIGLLSVCWTSQVHGGEAEEILNAVAAREASVKSMHLRWTSSTHFTTEYSRTKEAQELHQHANGRERGSIKPQPDVIRTEELFLKFPFFAQREFDSNGTLISSTTTEGTLRRSYSGGSRARFGGRIDELSSPLLSWSTPYASLMNLGGSFQFQDLISKSIEDSFTTRIVNGEKLIDFQLENSIALPNGSDSSQSVHLHSLYQVTVNASRSYWPISLDVLVTDQSTGQPKSRVVIITQGWIDAGSNVYPRKIERQSYLMAVAAESTELLLGATIVEDIELLEVNQPIPETVFSAPFPPGLVIYDTRDHNWYEAGPHGELKKYIPTPKGIQGAVLAYHLTWITLGMIFLLVYQRRPRENRTRV